MVAAEYLTATIPVKAERMNREYFCNDCRELLDDNKRCRYVLADIRDPEATALYPIEERSSFSIRCYEVEIGNREK